MNENIGISDEELEISKKYIHKPYIEFIECLTNKEGMCYMQAEKIHDSYADKGEISYEIELGKYIEAVEHVFRLKRTTATYIQRVMKMGYNKAFRYISKMQEDGIIGPKTSGFEKPKFLMTYEEWLELKRGLQDEKEEKK